MRRACLVRPTELFHVHPLTHRSIGDDEFAGLLGFGIASDSAAMLVRDQTAIRHGEAAQVSAGVERVTGRPPERFDAFAAAAPAWTGMFGR